VTFPAPISAVNIGLLEKTPYLGHGCKASFLQPLEIKEKP